MSQSLLIPAAGIDLGHGNVKIAYSANLDDEKLTLKVFPAIAPMLSTGAIRDFDGPRADGVRIEVDGLSYFVGADAPDYMKGIAPKVSQEGYSRSADYRALMLGALSLIAEGCGAVAGQDVEILCLGLGLPLTTYFKEREDLRQAWIGKALEVPVARGAVRVIVREVAVLAQPVGSLVAYAYSLAASDVARGEQIVESFNSTHALVLDAGGGTLDYLMTSGGARINGERSGANVNAMDKCTRAVAEKFAGPQLENWLANPHILRKINNAITNGLNLTLPSVNISATEYAPVVQTVIKSGLDEAMNRVGDVSDIELVLVVGGGGALYAEQFKKRHPLLEPHLVVESEPVFTNVRGFYRQALRKASSLKHALGMATAEVA